MKQIFPPISTVNIMGNQHIILFMQQEKIYVLQDTAPLMEMNPFITALKPDITLRVHGIPERRFFI